MTARVITRLMRVRLVERFPSCCGSLNSVSLFDLTNRVDLRDLSEVDAEALGMGHAVRVTIELVEDIQ